MNILKLVHEARAGRVLGARTASPSMNLVTNGVYPGMYIVVASEQKVGKSTFVLEFFLASLIELNPDIDFEWNIVSTEMPRHMLEAKLMSRKIYMDHKIALSTDYILGRKLDVNGQRIRLSDDHLSIIERVYNEYIVPLSGQYDDDGRLVHKGKINWISRDNPTGVRNQLVKYAEENGTIIYEEALIKGDEGTKVVHRAIGYKPNNTNKIVINVIDHMRQLHRERGFQMKDNVDKISEYLVELSRVMQFVNIGVVHLNRWVNVDTLKFFGDKLKPTSDSTKDSGNVGEDCSLMITLMDPTDPAYKLNRHFGVDFRAYNQEYAPKKYRSAHIVENRYGDTIDFSLSYLGAASHFSEIKL
jgi:replicative DNA helicase